MLKLEDGIYRLGDTSLEYRWIRGDNTSTKTLVLLHEGLGSVSAWKGFPEKLHERTGHDIFLYSRESYGKSSRLSGPRQYDYHSYEARDVLAPLLVSMDIQEPVLIGHSDGATIALIYAATNQLPTTTGMVLMAPHVFVEEETWSSVVPVLKAYKDSGLREKLAAYHDDVDGAFFGWYDFWANPEVLEWNIENILPDVHCPLLLVQGDEDEYATRAQLDAIAGQCSGSSNLHMLGDCRHTPFRDQEETCLDLMQGFIEGL